MPKPTSTLTRKQKNIIKRWVAKLRTNEYKQGTLALHIEGEGRRKDTFCCLGVLCEMAVKAKVIPKPDAPEEACFSYDGSTDVLPESVREWAGLRTHGGEYDAPESLASMNDKGASFKKIAKFIESNLKSNSDGLFV